MGAIQKAAQSKAVEKQNGGFKGLLDHAWPRMAAVLPKHMSADRMYQLALSAYNQTPELAQCSPQSVLCVLDNTSAVTWQARRTGPVQRCMKRAAPHGTALLFLSFYNSFMSALVHVAAALVPA